jgi:hypothetical protein
VCCGFVTLRASQNYLGKDLTDLSVRYMLSKGLNPDEYFVSSGSVSKSDTVFVQLWPIELAKSIKEEQTENGRDYEEFMFFEKDPFVTLFYDSLANKIIGHKSPNLKSR